ncbi:MAG: hypothetical protein QNJ41_28230 [Xenococcaceae cyanobacterium MO_188.B32]|nr:hypothetical protein [Xenococcaceae cyanobacterium MO_188.B32]
MPRKPNPTCVYCAKNYRTEEEAKAKHPECYVGHNCRIKRNRLRNPGQINAKRRANYARKLGVSTIDPLLPEAYRAELAIYGQENQFVHALALKIYQGNKLTHQMLPQHTQGLRQPELEAYIQKLLNYLQTEYGIDCFGLIYWLKSEDCPECQM